MRSKNIPLPGPDWERIDLRVKNSSRHSFGVRSPSKVFLLTRDRVYSSLEDFEKVDKEILERELFCVKWFYRFLSKEVDLGDFEKALGEEI
jgi:hypothetical protein